MLIVVYNIDMTILFVCLTVVLFLSLAISSAMRPIRANVSQFELQRRKKRSENSDKRTLEREANAPAIEAILKLDSAYLLVILSVTSVAFYGWVIGSLILVLAVLASQVAAQIAPVQKISRLAYARFENQLLKIAKKGRSFWGLLADSSKTNAVEIHSRDELIHILRDSKKVINADQVSRIINGLEFTDKTVKDIMTPRSKIETVDKNDLLGPATLDVLYKTGHSRLPVIDGDIDQAIGVLYIDNLLIATSKETPTASDVMRTPVCRIEQDLPLEKALDLMLKGHYDLALVVGKANKIVGLISLGAVIRQLTGSKDR